VFGPNLGFDEGGRINFHANKSATKTKQFLERWKKRCYINRMAEVQPGNEPKVEGTVDNLPPTAEQLMRAQPINPYTPLIFTKLSNVQIVPKGMKEESK
jgi:hypothetical protein